MATPVTLVNIDGTPVAPIPVSVFAGTNGASLNVRLESAQLFWDDFATGTIDATNKWVAPTTGGGGNATAATNVVGFTKLGSGTTASGWSIFQSQPSFAGKNPGYIIYQANINIEFPVLTNAYRFWGFATIPGAPTAALPLTDAVGFEIGTNGKLSAVTFASGARNQIADLSISEFGQIGVPQPADSSSHNYRLDFRGDNIIWSIDHNVVAQTLTGALGPDVNTLPLGNLAVAGLVGPSSSALIQINGVTVGDSSRNTQGIRDATLPWVGATVAKDGAQIVASGVKNVYNVTASAVIKATPGRIARISVINGGSATGTINDCATTGAIAAGNLIFTVPTGATSAGIYTLDWPCTTGIVYGLGTGQVVAISYA